MTGSAMTDMKQVDDDNDLRQQLDGKNELIAALVAELEQVVEQLDRVKRNGTDRGRTSAGGAALPAEVVEEHQQVLGDLQRVIQEWENVQPAAALGRIESEIAELRSLMASGGFRGRSGDDCQSDDEQRDNLDSVMSRISDDHSVAQDPSMMTLSGNDWEAMKRQMLGESPDHPEAEADDLAKLLEEIAAPSPIDFDSVNFEALKRACVDRDTYIVQVTRWIRTRRAVSIPDNWEELAEVPEELRSRVEHLASRLEEQVRLAEVEMSLERARLSREKSQLQADRAVMDKHLKRLGITSLDELEDIAVSSSSTGDRRWMRFLGVNRKS